MPSATGRDLSDFRFHRVLAMLKLAVIFHQLHARYRQGATRTRVMRASARWPTAYSNSPMTSLAARFLRGIMDFSLPPDLHELQERTRAFIRERDHPARGRPAPDRARPDERAPRRADRARRAEAGLLAPHVVRRIWRPRPGPYRQGDRVRRGRLLAARPAGAEHLCAGRGQHPSARGGRRPRRRRSAGCARWREGEIALLLRDDRAGAGRRVRPVDAAHHGACGTATTTSSTAPNGSSPAPRARHSPSSWPHASEDGRGDHVPVRTWSARHPHRAR